MPLAAVRESWEAVFLFELEESASFTSLKKLLWERKERISQTRGLSISHALSGPWAWVPSFLEGLGGFLTLTGSRCHGVLVLECRLLLRSDQQLVCCFL